MQYGISRIVRLLLDALMVGWYDGQEQSRKERLFGGTCCQWHLTFEPRLESLLGVAELIHSLLVELIERCRQAAGYCRVRDVRVRHVRLCRRLSRTGMKRDMNRPMHRLVSSFSGMSNANNEQMGAQTHF